MIVLAFILGLAAGFGIAWFIYTKKIDAIKGEALKMENSAIADVRAFVGRIKAHL